MAGPGFVATLITNPLSNISMEGSKIAIASVYN